MEDIIDDTVQPETPFTTGRFQFLGRDRYYSPNSILNARLNLRPLQNYTSNPFQPNRIGANRVRYQDFVDPRPWDIRFGYLAFLPVVPSQWFDPHTYLGNILLKPPPIDHYINGDGKEKKHGWAIPPENSWRTLEKDLYAAAVALSGHYHVPIILPFLPNAIGYTEMYRYKCDLTRRLEEALDWFFVWFGVVTRQTDPMHSDMLPYAFRLLLCLLRSSASGISTWISPTAPLQTSPSLLIISYNSAPLRLRSRLRLRKSGVSVRQGATHEYVEAKPAPTSLRSIVRDSFLTGVLSFLLAWLRLNPVAGARHAFDHELTAVLLERGVSPTFVDALMCSLFATDDPKRVRRAGTIVDVKKDSQANTQPYPDWFTFWGVPVWYTWNDEEENGNDLIGQFRPPAHLFLPPPPSSHQQEHPLGRDPADGPPSEEAHPDVAMQDPLPSIEINAAIASSSSPARPFSVDQNSAFVTDSNGVEIALQSSLTSPIHVPEDDDVGSLSAPSIAPGGSQIDAVAAPKESQAERGPEEPQAKSQQEPEWVAFFKTRDADHARRLAVETPQDRTTRLNRTREPATQTAKVFEWFKTGEAGKWERHPVVVQGRLDTLRGYGESQKRYDPFENEWDCCSEWGDDEEEEMYDEPPGGNDAPTIPPPAAAAFVRVDRPSTPPAVSFVDSDSPTEVFVAADAKSGGLETEVTEILTHFFGFNHLVPGESGLPSSSAIVGPKDKIFFLRVVGVDPASTSDKHPYSNTGEFVTAQQFVKALCDHSNPRAGSWDLLDDCVRPVRLTPRFRSIRIVQLADKDKVEPHDSVERYYVFDNSNTDGPFKVGVLSATSAALVCRLAPSICSPDIAAFLSSYGVPFRVFYPSRSIIKPPPFRKIPLEIPKRPFNHKFTKRDYDSYLQMRTLLLGQSHMQAALKRGGIIWRLAVGTLGTSKVAFPPSLWASSHSFDLSGVRYVDDALTTTEMDLICGAYECISADGKQRSLKSWWPLCRYYEKDECGENYGRWTPRRENHLSHVAEEVS
ncbi:hypothetical protein NMY22_g11303 [Coprinellus aureogranulatus]|nr:hypothetical protein NMY22_g11303 [Coprinellus aureogranulatus]